MRIMQSIIRSYRVRAGLSSRELAEKLEIPEVTLRSLENGNRPITAERAVELEKKLGIPRSELRPDLFQGV